MSDKKKLVLDIFEKLLPKMSDMDIEKLLAFGEGMAFKVDQQPAIPDAQKSA